MKVISICPLLKASNPSNHSAFRKLDFPFIFLPLKFACRQMGRRNAFRTVHNEDFIVRRKKGRESESACGLCE